MKCLQDLLTASDVLAVRGDATIAVHQLAFDSRQVVPGDCFVALRGFHQDGIEFLPEAAARGAVAVVSSQPPSSDWPTLVWVQVKNDRRTLSQMATRFFDNPSQRLTVIGVTGTNGKSTTVALTQAILSRQAPTAWIGTLGMGYGSVLVPPALTTPEAPDIFRFMAEAESGGCRYLAMEVSSASLSLSRVADICFAQAVFTSFSGEHLDFHGTMENYLEAKLSLFRNLASDSWAVVNLDDAQAPHVIQALNCRYLGCGFSPTADVRPLKAEFSLEGIRAQLQTPKGEIAIRSPLLGRFNLSNILAAVTVALIQGVRADEIAGVLADFTAVPGRMEVVYRGEFLGIVDFAHTDEALLKLLQHLREIVGRRRIILVFGAGGERDRSKRPRMGRVAAAHADLLYLTSDNPRREDPQVILDEIAAGFPPGFTRFVREPDRFQAIADAVAQCQPGDVLVLAGKGHEESQIVGDRDFPFSDRQVLLEMVGRRHG